ncbi:MAG: glutamate-1-semialdehyde 2,1-aminomutase [Flavobacteriales bacterium]|nr:glutamate-1-semialdehyde 2,1-aminomutase [Flavobacteriales bacterium]
MNTERSEKLYVKAQSLFPGGVNSPVRAFGAVSGDPIFIAKGKGARLWDVDGNEYIDFCCSWGPLIHGHVHPEVMRKVEEVMHLGTSFGAPTELENQLASLIIDNNRMVDTLRFVSSGTEATMSAIRLSRGYTGRNKILKFEGCYHGHSDGLLVKAGSGLATLGTASSAGVPAGYARETIVIPLADEGALQEAFKQHGQDLACVITEPLPANNGLLRQDPAYLRLLRELCTKAGTVLIFDEVITGFRLGFEGAAGYYDIIPDLVTYGKVIGGGFPVGAYGGKQEIMEQIAPSGPVYQAGTLSGNPVAMAGGLAQLSLCLQSGFYDHLAARTREFCERITESARQSGFPFSVVSEGSIFFLSLNEMEPPKAAHEIDPAAIKLFSEWHRLLLEEGVYVGPSGYEVCFLSSAHTDEDLDQAAQGIQRSLERLFS